MSVAAHRHRFPLPLDLGGVWYPLRAVLDHPVRFAQTLSYHRGRPASPKVCRGWVAVPPLVVVMSQLLSVAFVCRHLSPICHLQCALECAPVCRHPGLQARVQQLQGQLQATLCLMITMSFSQLWSVLLCAVNQVVHFTWSSSDRDSTRPCRFRHITVLLRLTPCLQVGICVRPPVSLGIGPPCELWLCSLSTAVTHVPSQLAFCGLCRCREEGCGVPTPPCLPVTVLRHSALLIQGGWCSLAPCLRFSDVFC